MSDVTAKQQPAKLPTRSMRRIVAASLFGTALETYDIYLYGTAAALVFAPLFFPAGDNNVALLLSISTFAISFIARPIGAIVFGHFGDRIGRKKMLYITLLLMGASTMAIGLLPTYEVAGLWAPLLLCILRFAQGFGFAGEYSGAVLMLVESAPAEKRGFYAGINNVGPVFGFVLSAGAFLLVGNSMSEQDFLAWGWRLPFLASVILLGIGVFVRTRLPESPVFEATKKTEAERPNRMPVFQVIRYYPKELLLASGANICHFATFYIFSVFALSYGKTTLGLSNATVLSILMLAISLHVVFIPYASARSDRIGRKKSLYLGFGAIALTVFPFWALFSTGDYWPMLLGSCMLMIAYSFVYGPLASFTTETFGPSVRFTGAALAYNIGGIVGGGLAPVLATMLLTEFGSPYPIAAYILILALVSITCVAFSRETRAVDLLEDRADKQNTI